jgi:poly-beta-1,6-N-acetyl-D-glucosamine synthase
MTAGTILHPIVFACAVYLVLLYGSYTILAVFGAIENRDRRNELDREDLETNAGSPFAATVSIVLAAYNEESAIVPAVRSLLELDYPVFEVVVVSDGSTDATVARLERAFELVAVDVSRRSAIATEPIRRSYRSTGFPLTVVDKENGGKADALNAGLNHCRYRYICGVDADVVFARDALLTTMRAFTKDPDTTVGLTSYVEIAEDPSRTMSAPPGERPADGSLLITFQTLDYLRSFFNNRIAWSRFNFMLCAIGAFQIWRRDVLEEVGGWSRDYTCEDIELTFRLHQQLRRQRVDYRIVCLPDTVGATEGPDTVRKLVSQRERWQRVTLETWWAYRHMLLNPRYGTVGLLGMPFYFLSEIVAPLFEVAAVVTLVAGVSLGLVDWRVFAIVTLAIALFNACFNAMAILAVEVQSAAHRRAALARLLLAGPLELVLFRPVIGWARLKGTWRFFRRDKGWHKFERNVRTETA